MTQSSNKGKAMADTVGGLYSGEVQVWGNLYLNYE